MIKKLKALGLAAVSVGTSHLGAEEQKAVVFQDNNLYPEGTRLIMPGGAEVIAPKVEAVTFPDGHIEEVQLIEYKDGDAEYQKRTVSNTTFMQSVSERSETIVDKNVIVSAPAVAASGDVLDVTALSNKIAALDSLADMDYIRMRTDTSKPTVVKRDGQKVTISPKTDKEINVSPRSGELLWNSIYGLADRNKKWVTMSGNDSRFVSYMKSWAHKTEVELDGGNGTKMNQPGSLADRYNSLDAQIKELAAQGKVTFYTERDPATNETKEFLTGPSAVPCSLLMQEKYQVSSQIHSIYIDVANMHTLLQTFRAYSNSYNRHASSDREIFQDMAAANKDNKQAFVIITDIANKAGIRLNSDLARDYGDHAKTQAEQNKADARNARPGVPTKGVDIARLKRESAALDK